MSIPSERATIEDDLASVLWSLTDQAHARTLAARVLEHDTGDRRALIGVDYTGTRVILLDPANMRAVAVPISETEIGDGRPPIASFRNHRHLRHWIEKMRLYWGWLHPRYR